MSGRGTSSSEEEEEKSVEKKTCVCSVNNIARISGGSFFFSSNTDAGSFLSRQGYHALVAFLAFASKTRNMSQPVPPFLGPHQY